MKTFHPLLGKIGEFRLYLIPLTFVTLFFSGFIFSQEKSFTQKLEGLQTSGKELVKSASTDNSSVGQAGQLNTSVPVITVSSRTMKFPLQLSYQSGIKVDDKSGPVGLGWAMNSGSIRRDFGAFQPDYSSTASEVTMKYYDNDVSRDGHVNPSSNNVNPVDYHKLLQYDAIDANNGKGSLFDKYHVNVPGLESSSFWNAGVVDGPHSWEWSNVSNSKIDFDVKTFVISQEFSRINENVINANPNVNFSADKTKFNYMLNGSWTSAIGVLPYVKNGLALRSLSNNPSYTERRVKYEDFETFRITGDDGKTYVFGRPLRGQKYIFSDDPYWNSVASPQGEGIENNFWKIDFIAEWLLTEILSVDYADVNGNGIADDGDAGDWIRIEYTQPTKHELTTLGGNLPGNRILQEVPMHREWSSFSQTDQSSSLMRERAYLKKIITPTETYDFKISERFDVDHDFYSKPANKVDNDYYYEDRQYSMSTQGSSPSDFDVRYPVETMKYDSVYISSRLIDKQNYPTENLIKGAVAFRYADKGSSEELAVSSYLIRNNDNYDKDINRPSEGVLDFEIEDYKNSTDKRGKTTLLGVDYLNSDLEQNDKTSYEFEYGYNPSYDEIHKREITRKYFFPSIRSTDNTFPANKNQLNFDITEKIVDPATGLYPSWSINLSSILKNG